MSDACGPHDRIDNPSSGSYDEFKLDVLDSFDLEGKGMGQGMMLKMAMSHKGACVSVRACTSQPVEGTGSWGGGGPVLRPLIW